MNKVLLAVVLLIILAIAAGFKSRTSIISQAKLDIIDPFIFGRYFRIFVNNLMQFISIKISIINDYSSDSLLSSNEYDVISFFMYFNDIFI